MITKTKSRSGIWAAGLVLALLAVLMVMPSANASNGGLVGANIQDGQLKGYYGNGGDIVIPNIVTVIAPEAFKGNDNITSITIPGSVNTIGFNAFEGCTALEAVYFSDPVIGADLTIRVNAFMNCPRLAVCEIPACAVYVTGNPFKGCDSMAAIKVHPENPYYFTDDKGVLFGPWVDYGEPQYDDPNYALNAYPCGAPEGGYTIPSEVNGHPINRVWASAFWDAKNLTDIEIPASCKILGASAFAGTGLTNVTIPATVEEVDFSLFSDCPWLTDVTIESPIVTLGMNFFENCTSLQRVNLPSSVRTIEMYAFKGCTSITNLILPEKLSTLDIGLFEGCSNLQRVFIPASVVNFPIVDGMALDPFEGTSPDLMVYVVKGSTGEKWAYNRSEELGFNYQLIDGPHQLPTLDAGTFNLIDMGKKVKLTGPFHMTDSMIVRSVTSGPEYDAFKASTEGAVAVYQISMANGASAPDSMTLGIGRPAGMGSGAKLYKISNSQVTPVASSTISGTLTAQINELGYYAVIDGSSSGGGTVDPTVPSGIRLNTTNTQVEAGKRIQLSATVLPNEAANKTVTWKSSAPSIAEVNSRGVVTGVSEGTATITASTFNGFEAQCTVKVTSGSVTPPPVPPTPTPSDAITASAAVRAGNALTPDGKAPFALNLADASRIATVEVQFETNGSAVSVKGSNGFVLLGDVKGSISGGKYKGTAMLCFLNGERTLFNSADESAIAQFAVTGENPSFKVTGLTISGWDSKNNVAYGTVKGINPAEDTFTGSMSYDLNEDGTVDQLDITWAQMYYRAQPGDINWNVAKHCDFNGDSLIDISDFIDILMHFTAR